MSSARRGTATAGAVAVLGVLGALLLTLVATAPAAEAASYRYWTYWWGQPGSTSWTFAQLGPASDRPRDGSVVGWRFAVTTEAGGRTTPRATLPFDTLCPGMAPAPTGEKRVAVVVDYGSPEDAPPGERPPGAGTARVECVRAAADARAVAVLNAAGVSLRFGTNGLVCGIDGYPRSECAAVVADPTPTPTPARTSTTPSAAPKPTQSSPRPTTTSPRATTSSAQPAATLTESSTPGSSTAATDPGSSTAAVDDPTSAAPATTSATPASSPGDASTEASEAPLPVSSGAPVASGTEGGSGSGPAGPALGVALVLALGAGAWWTARGRRS